MTETALPASAKTMTFLITQDRERTKTFFSDVLGFTLVSEDPFAIVYDLNGTMLRISGPMEFKAQPFTVLGWEVPDIAASVKVLAAKGVQFKFYEGFGQDDLGIWTAPGGTKVAWFPDPDGNLLSLTEF